LRNWLTTLKPIWIPVLSDAGGTRDAVDAVERIGISITEKLARMWGHGDDLMLFENIAGDWMPITVTESNEVAIFAQDLSIGCTVGANNSSAVLVAPTF
jgi:hypothetical protein